MKNIGFTGTRHGMTEWQAVAFRGLLDELPANWIGTFHHGSCAGADVQAARLMRAACSKARIISHPGPKADPYRDDSGVDDLITPDMTHFARNREIVKVIDVLVAAPFDSAEQSYGGTWYTIHYATKVGKSVKIIWPNGDIENR